MHLQERCNETTGGRLKHDVSRSGRCSERLAALKRRWEMDRLLEMSGHLVEDLLEFARAENMSAAELWELMSFSHVVLGDLLYPDNARAAYDGAQAAFATYQAVMGCPQGPSH